MECGRSGCYHNEIARRMRDVRSINEAHHARGIQRNVVVLVTAGARIVWVVDPESVTVMVYSGNLHGDEQGQAATIDGGSVLPDSSCKAVDFFVG